MLNVLCFDGFMAESDSEESSGEETSSWHVIITHSTREPGVIIPGIPWLNGACLEVAAVEDQVDRGS